MTLTSVTKITSRVQPGFSFELGFKIIKYPSKCESDSCTESSVYSFSEVGMKLTLPFENCCSYASTQVTVNPTANQFIIAFFVMHLQIYSFRFFFVQLCYITLLHACHSSKNVFRYLYEYQENCIDSNEIRDRLGKTDHTIRSQSRADTLKVSSSWMKDLKFWYLDAPSGDCRIQTVCRQPNR